MEPRYFEVEEDLEEELDISDDLDGEVDMEDDVTTKILISGLGQVHEMDSENDLSETLNLEAVRNRGNYNPSGGQQ